MTPTEIKNYIQNIDEIIGDIEYVHEFYSVHLKTERDILIWFPPSYFESNKEYPVLYMHDGQNLFDPHTSFTGYDWKVDEVTTKLIEENSVNEFIIVAIYNTKDRIDEYNYFTQKGKAYARFIIKELKPFIDEKYRTIPKASGTGLMGSSMGGLISFQLFWNFPKIFGKAACMSNSFWVNDRAVFKMVNDVNSLITLKNKLYIDCGTEEKELLPDFIKMVKILSEKNFEIEKNFHFYLAKGGHHSEVDWAKRLHIPLKFLFDKK